MNRLLNLFSVLDRWKPHYTVAGLLLILTSVIRMMEPKVLQVAVDGVVLALQNPDSQGGKSLDTDRIASVFYDIIPEVSRSNAGEILLLLAFVYLVIAGLRAGSSLIAGGLTAWATEKAVKKLRDRLFRRIQELPLSTHNRIPTGEMVQRSTGDVDTVKRFLLNDVAEMVRLTALFLAAFWMMYIVHIPYALIAIVLVPVIAVMSVIFFRKESVVWESHEAEQDKLTAIVQENLSGNQVVRAFAREPEEIEKFDRQNKVKLGVGLKHVGLHMRFWSFSDALVNLQITISLMAGGWYVLQGAITLGEFVSFFTYSIMVTWPLRQVGQITSRMGMAAVAMDRMSGILNAETEPYEPLIPLSAGQRIPERFRGEIEFRNVTFRYPSDDENKVNPNAVRQLSFRIKPGSHTAIVGPTGSGKSTVIALLLRFYDPEEGAIYLDGIDIRCLNKKHLRKSVGAVLQNPFLFSTSLYSNIAYSRKSASAAEIDAAARDACIIGLLDRFPEGLETVVGERGLTLSGGQQQRVALARTLLSDPDVLVLDDTTSAVDTGTEEHIAAALADRRGNRTMISISHRTTSIRDADRILVLSGGQLIQDGSAEELMNREGYYREIATLQQLID